MKEVSPSKRSKIEELECLAQQASKAFRRKTFVVCRDRVTLKAKELVPRMEHE
jgi:hypothetical protein